jgi:hypothetical protein
MVVIFGPANSPARTDCTIIKELLPAGRQAGSSNTTAPYRFIRLTGPYTAGWLALNC